MKPPSSSRSCRTLLQAAIGLCLLSQGCESARNETSASNPAVHPFQWQSERSRLNDLIPEERKYQQPNDARRTRR